MKRRGSAEEEKTEGGRREMKRRKGVRGGNGRWEGRGSEAWGRGSEGGAFREG